MLFRSRRQLFGETNEGVKTRAAGLLAQDFRVMVCIGETRGERESGSTFAVLAEQLAPLFAPEFTQAWESARILLAYEPVWAIGTGKVATPKQANEVHHKIRTILGDLFGPEGKNIRILYGGSVKPENSAELMAENDIDGFLVGGASLDSRSFFDIIQSARPARVSEHD